MLLLRPDFVELCHLNKAFGSLQRTLTGHTIQTSQDLCDDPHLDKKNRCFCSDLLLLLILGAPPLPIHSRITQGIFILENILILLKDAQYSASASFKGSLHKIGSRQLKLIAEPLKLSEYVRHAIGESRLFGRETGFSSHKKTPKLAFLSGQKRHLLTLGGVGG